ncbi:hypothetical protein EJ02DRAFT_471763 [Clathrospora elynae]|uniref:Uncharacterized protein n=1 Tax=Clathrospora elynae TaxID=706981 RepID=A0A6A5S4B5_9PLEO|nr:hypothetical protein EJ02DRAFT_471763 [Clathrospora elynae]
MDSQSFGFLARHMADCFGDAFVSEFYEPKSSVLERVSAQLAKGTHHPTHSRLLLRTLHLTVYPASQASTKNSIAFTFFAPTVSNKYFGSPMKTRPSVGNWQCLVQSTCGNSLLALTNKLTRSWGRTKKRTFLQKRNRKSTILAKRRFRERCSQRCARRTGTMRMFKAACSSGVVAVRREWTTELTVKSAVVAGLASHVMVDVAPQGLGLRRLITSHHDILKPIVVVHETLLVINVREVGRELLCVLEDGNVPICGKRDGAQILALVPLPAIEMQQMSNLYLWFPASVFEQMEHLASGLRRWRHLRVPGTVRVSSRKP